MPKTRIKKKTNTTGGFQDLGYTLTEDELTKITEIDNKAPKSHKHVKADITDFPTIPTVNNGTLTIQKNGTSVGTFTANQSGNSTANITVPDIYYGTSSTAAATAAKVVSCANFSSLETGVYIIVGFTYGNSARASTLNVNSTGAVQIRYRTANSFTTAPWKAGDTLIFRYSGTYWDLIGNLDTNTTYTLSSFGVTATSTELNYCGGVTSNIQTQLDAKADSSAIPTTTSQLTNDSGFITSADLPASSGVTSVVGQTGDVTADQIITGIQTSGSGFACGGGASATTGGAIGSRATSTTGGAVGLGASTSSGFAGGQGAVASWGGVAIGYAAQATITEGSSGHSSVAIGASAQATKKNAIQLGYGTNSTADTLQFRNTTIVNSDGDLVFPKTVEQIGMIEGVSSTTFSNSSGEISITKYRFIMLVSMRSDLWRAPFVIPTAYIAQDYTRIYGIECWDGSRYRIRFDNDLSATITAGYYSGKVYIYGIK